MTLDLIRFCKIWFFQILYFLRNSSTISTNPISSSLSNSDFEQVWKLYLQLLSWITHVFLLLLIGPDNKKTDIVFLWSRVKSKAKTFLRNLIWKKQPKLLLRFNPSSIFASLFVLQKTLKHFSIFRSFFKNRKRWFNTFDKTSNFWVAIVFRF